MDLYGFNEQTQHTTAIELKLTKWTKAIQQAILYQLCADHVYIALPASAISRVDRCELDRLGVGLISVVSATCCTLVVPPARSHCVIAGYRDFYISLVQGVMNK
jgi:hypothetical protein